MTLSFELLESDELPPSLELLSLEPPSEASEPLLDPPEPVSDLPEPPLDPPELLPPDVPPEEELPPELLSPEELLEPDPLLTPLPLLELPEELLEDPLLADPDPELLPDSFDADELEPDALEEELPAELEPLRPESSPELSAASWLCPNSMTSSAVWVSDPNWPAIKMVAMRAMTMTAATTMPMTTPRFERVGRACCPA